MLMGHFNSLEISMIFTVFYTPILCSLTINELHNWLVYSQTGRKKKLMKTELHLNLIYV